MKHLNWTRTWLLCSVIVGASLLSQQGPATRSVAWAADEGAGTFSGQIVLEGDIPKLDPAITVADPARAADLKACGVESVPNEKLVVDPKSKGIANAFVYLRKAPAGMRADLKKSTAPMVKFDQKACQFTPHSLLVRVDQTVEVLSDDPIGHNTHVTPLKGTEFNSAIRPKDRAGVPVKMKTVENLPTQVKCDIHPWMTAWWLILDHPYAAVTDKEGKFSIPNLPPGEHDFMVWQESVGYIERGKVKITIDGKAKPAAKIIKVPVANIKL